MRLKEGRFYGALYGPYNDYTARQMDRQMVTERGDLWVHFTASYTDRINLYGPYNEPYNDIGTEVEFYKI